MTEAEHNDAFLKAEVIKILDRLNAEQAEYQKRVDEFVAKNTATIVPIPGSGGSLGLSISYSYSGYGIPPWVPYLQQDELETLTAWRNGQNMIIHKLSKP